MTRNTIPGQHFDTWVDILQSLAAERPDTKAFGYLRDGEGDEEKLCYAELDRSARSIAATLRRLGAEGQRVLLLYPRGSNSFRHFWGVCMPAPSLSPPIPRPHALGAIATAAASHRGRCPDPHCPNHRDGAWAGRRAVRHRARVWDDALAGDRYAGGRGGGLAAAGHRDHNAGSAAVHLGLHGDSLKSDAESCPPAA